MIAPSFPGSAAPPVDGRTATSPQVIVDTSSLRGFAGTRGLGRYTTEVLAALTRRQVSHYEWDSADALPWPAREERLRELYEAVARTAVLRGMRPDVYHAPHVRSVALPGSWRFVSSILDVIPLDVSSHRRTGLKNRCLHGLAARSDAILTLSEFSRSRIIDRLGVDAASVTVAPLPVHSPFAAGPGPHPEVAASSWPNAVGERPYFLTVADLSRPDPRKRLEWLAPVADQLSRVGMGFVVVGRGSERLEVPAQGLGLVSDGDLASLMRQAYAFVYPSAYEGQGLPPLEALACGTPVVAFANTSIPEVVQDAGVLIEEEQTPEKAAVGPHDVHDRGCRALVDACTELANDASRRDELAARCRAAAARFSPANFDAALLRAYGMSESTGG